MIIRVVLEIIVSITCLCEHLSNFPIFLNCVSDILRPTNKHRRIGNDHVYIYIYIYISYHIIYIIYIYISYIMLNSIYNPWTKDKFGTDSVLENWKS